MQVTGYKINNFSSITKFSNLERILEYASPKLKKCVLGKNFHNPKIVIHKNQTRYVSPVNSKVNQINLRAKRDGWSNKTVDQHN